MQVRVTGDRDADRVLARLPRLVQSRAERAVARLAALVPLRAKLRARGVGRQAARAAGELSSSGAQVVVGGSDWFWGAEFGGQGRPTTQQFQPYTGTRGLFLWPTIRDLGDRSAEELDGVLDDAVAEWQGR